VLEANVAIFGIVGKERDVAVVGSARQGRDCLWSKCGPAFVPMTGGDGRERSVRACCDRWRLTDQVASDSATDQIVYLLAQGQYSIVAVIVVAVTALAVVVMTMVMAAMVVVVPSWQRCHGEAANSDDIIGR
jgi:hypothetical protein